MSDVPSLGHHQAHAAARKRRRKWLILGIVFLALLFLSPLVVGGIRAVMGLRAAYQQLQTVQQAALERRLGDARESLGGVEVSLTEVETGVRWMLFWRAMPVVRSYVFTLQESVGAARSTLQGARDLLDVAELVQEAFVQVGVGVEGLQNPLAPNRSFRELSREEKQQILGRISQALPALRAAQEQMRIALGRWQSVPRDGLAGPLRQELELRIAQFETIQSQLSEAVRLAEVFLPLAGYPEMKNYLVILQNNQEMRGTGGFIGTVGEVVIDSGDVQKMVFQDVYAIDLPVSGVWNKPSPAPIAKWLEQKTLFFRDANWSPDFPQTADALLRQYGEERALAQAPTPTFDGLIALQPGLFRRLMQLIGPIQIEDQTFTAENFYDALQYDVHVKWHQEGVPPAQRKEVVAKLGNALFQKLTTVPVRQWPELLEILTTSLAQKDLMVYAADENLQRLLDRRDWSGRTKDGPVDSLWVIDSNLAAWKTDGVMDKQILYGLDATNPTDVRATVTLRYRNTNPKPDWRYIHYRDYVRIYVPEGAELISSVGAMDNDLIRNKGQLIPGQVDSYRELGKTVFGAFFAVEPGKTGELQFTYRLPSRVSNAIHAGTYELLLQKQPGSTARVVIDARFPKALNSALPPEAANRFGDARYQQTLPLETDQKVFVQW